MKAVIRQVQVLVPLLPVAYTWQLTLFWLIHQVPQENALCPGEAGLQTLPVTKA